MTAIDRAVAVMAGEAGPTLCVNCKHMQAIGKSAPEWTWLCRAWPQELKFSYLTGKETGEPYRQCRHVNVSGNCSSYVEGLNALSPPKLVPDGHGGMVKMEESDNGK